ncbi:MAG: hypothetical protein ACRDDJ_08135, partial [[Mycobacterium] stephanolepidis]
MENAIIGANWPAEPVAAIAARDNYAMLKERFFALSDQTKSDAEEQRELLKGRAGDAHYDALRELAGKSYELGKHFAGKELAAQQHVDITSDAQAMQIQIAADGRKAYEANMKAKNPSAANAAVLEHAAQVAEKTATAAADIQALSVRDPMPGFHQSGHAFKTTPMDHKTPVPPNKSEFPSLDKPRRDDTTRALDHEKNTKPPSAEHGKQTDTDAEKSEAKTKDGDAEGKQTDTKSVLGNKAGDGLTKSEDVAHMKQSDVAGEQTPAQQPFAGMPGSTMSQMPGGGSPSGMGSGAGSGMGGLSGLSSQASSLQSGLGGAKSSMPSGLGSGGGGSTPTVPSSS